MDLQKLVNVMNENSARQRSGYHLTYGGMIAALEKAKPNTLVDIRIKGIGSWRGSYTEIAIFTKDAGYHAEKEEFNDYGGDELLKRYKAFQDKNVTAGKELPRKAGELAALLKSLLGLHFVGYKGGHFKIEKYKPLWLSDTNDNSGDTAIIGIDDKLKLITKNVD